MDERRGESQRMDRKTIERMKGRTDGVTDGRMDGRTYERTNGRSDGGTDGRTEESTDDRNDGRSDRLRIHLEIIYECI